MLCCSSTANDKQLKHCVNSIIVKNADNKTNESYEDAIIDR